MKKRFSRALSLILAVLTILSTAVIFPVTSSAETEGIYTYTVTNGEATITDCLEYASGDITIPETLGGYPVTGIGDWAFYWYTSLTDDITIPEGVTSIGSYAFGHCTLLTSITIPDSVTSIGDYAFYACTLLTSITVDTGNASFCSENGILFNKDKSTLICYPAGISNNEYTIPDSVTSIGNGVFYNCPALTDITIPDSVTSIGDEAFYGCTTLTDITIPDSVTTINSNAFNYCTSLTSITSPTV